jgi:GNAT superfamily N-acetyltransferase
MIVEVKRNIYIIMLLALVLMSLSMKPESDSFTIKVLVDSELQKILPFIVEQRITLFREYPYLYEGNAKEENTYLTWFSKLPHSAVVVAYLGDDPVGFVTGTDFTAFSEHFEGSSDLFKRAGLNPWAYYYIAEIIILPSYRGNHLSKRLFDAIEAYAYKCGYTASCFVTESHDVHPLKPKNYRSLEPLWADLGYAQSSLFIHFSWLTIQPDTSGIQQEHKLDYWLKDLNKERPVILPEVTFRAQTKEEAFHFILYLSKKLSWFKHNGYTVPLPQHKAFDILYRQGKVTKDEEELLRTVFYSEVYKTESFKNSLQSVSQFQDTIKLVLRQLCTLHQNWGFALLPAYEVILTLYGPGGNYWPDKGYVIIRVNENGSFNKPVLDSIVHELVHIGIEKTIVTKFNLSHWEKERLVDLICSLYLKDVLPNYKMQKIVDTKIDAFVNQTVIEKNLPEVIEKFIKAKLQ